MHIIKIYLFTYICSYYLNLNNSEFEISKVSDIEMQR